MQNKFLAEKFNLFLVGGGYFERIASGKKILVKRFLVKFEIIKI
ncbi:hypothetical protein CAMGR0001_1095 [Campylobacter gracilis RM3268]|uniref:Uncharacterized protein n=1 Tax=Campylobacter gracilis RM3268 TaxID=553220 RepID=C8PGV0_9BACT|nr:hypothetical protein CAMGR0001_1095 [Campylobacter gracilis RM3268]